MKAVMFVTLLAALFTAPAAQAADPAGSTAARTAPDDGATVKHGNAKAVPTDDAGAQEKVVYHINDASLARVAMRNIENHLNASPGVKIVVVTHGKGIDFLLNDAKDDKGAYASQVAGLKKPRRHLRCVPQHPQRPQPG